MGEETQVPILPAFAQWDELDLTTAFGMAAVAENGYLKRLNKIDQSTHGNSGSAHAGISMGASFVIGRTGNI